MICTLYIDNVHTGYTYVILICVVIQCMHYIYTVFGKTTRRREMLDHSFERKFYGASYRLC